MDRTRSLRTVASFHDHNGLLFYRSIGIRQTVVDYSFTLLTDLVDQATMMASIDLSILPGPDE